MKSFKDLKSKMSSKNYFDMKNIKIISLFISLLLFFGLVSISSAATLVFSPLSGTYSEGSYIKVSVMVSSSDKVMNAASGAISFPSNLLSVSSISEDGSIMNVWPQAPSYSNTDGTINFQGVVLPPWYTGSSGKLITITFKAKAMGTANLSFRSGSVRAVDPHRIVLSSAMNGESHRARCSNSTQISL